MANKKVFLALVQHGWAKHESERVAVVAALEHGRPGEVRTFWVEGEEEAVDRVGVSNIDGAITWPTQRGPLKILPWSEGSVETERAYGENDDDAEYEISRYSISLKVVFDDEDAVAEVK